MCEAGLRATPLGLHTPHHLCLSSQPHAVFLQPLGRFTAIFLRTEGGKKKDEQCTKRTTWLQPLSSTGPELTCLTGIIQICLSQRESTQPAQNSTYYIYLYCSNSISSESNGGEATFGRCGSFSTSETAELLRLVCLHFIIHRRETGDEKQRRDIAGVPISLEISLSELSDVQCTDKEDPHVLTCAQVHNYKTSGKLGTRLRRQQTAYLNVVSFM